MKATNNAEALQSLIWDSCSKPSALALDHSPTIPCVSQPAFYSQVKKQFSNWNLLDSNFSSTPRERQLDPKGTLAQPEGNFHHPLSEAIG
jgi:hypothetical protein